MGRTRTLKGSLGQDPCGSLLSHPGSHKQDSCGSLGQHWGALEGGKGPCRYFRAQLPLSLPRGVLLAQMQPWHSWDTCQAGGDPWLCPHNSPSPGARMCPRCCPQRRCGANTHRVFVPPGSPGAGAATLSLWRARAGLCARQGRDCHTSVSAHTPSPGRGTHPGWPRDGGDVSSLVTPAWGHGREAQPGGRGWPPARVPSLADKDTVTTAPTVTSLSPGS